MGWRMKNFNISGVYRKIWLFSQENNIQLAKEDCLKEGVGGLGAWTAYIFKGEGA